MNIYERGHGSRFRQGTRALCFIASLALLTATWPQNLAAYQEQDQQEQDQSQAQDQSQPQDQSQAPPQQQYAPQTPEQLQQLVAPIALYPDSLVAQILAASTYPEEVVEADRWLQANPNLQGDALAQAVNQQPWDPSVKALTAFPSVLGNMDKNLSWTSSLGDAYYNQQDDVMNAIQVMRQKAQQAGTLQSTPQQTITTQGSTIIIQPANPTVVYVPAYDPWAVYGYPISPWPYWYPYPGIWYGGPYLSFGIGFGIGFFGGYAWGYPRWGFDWGRRTVIYNRNVYYSGSRTFYNRDNYYRGGRPYGGSPGHAYADGRPPAGNFNRPGNVYNHPGASPRPFEGNTEAARGYASPHGQSDVRTGAFSNYDHGGETRSYSARGSASFGGGGGFHGGGGGGFHGGGGRPR